MVSPERCPQPIDRRPDSAAEYERRRRRDRHERRCSGLIRDWLMVDSTSFVVSSLLDINFLCKPLADECSNFRVSPSSPPSRCRSWPRARANLKRAADQRLATSTTAEMLSERAGYRAFGSRRARVRSSSKLTRLGAERRRSFPPRARASAMVIDSFASSQDSWRSSDLTAIRT